MLRIYLTDEGLEGYNEGCSCCSSTEPATLKDIETLVSDLNSQIKNMEELHHLLKTYGDDTLGFWYTLLENVSRIKNRIEASQKYEKNPNTKGTYYKDCFETRVVDEKELLIAEKLYLRVPPRAKKYLEHMEK